MLDIFDLSSLHWRTWVNIFDGVERRAATFSRGTQPGSASCAGVEFLGDFQQRTPCAEM